MQVALDAMFFGACLNIGAHFDILKNSFDGDKKKFITKHQKLLELADELGTVIKPVVFVQFMITAMLLCVLGFQCVMFETFLDFQVLLVLAFGVAIILQLFIYSYGGQLIMDKSSSVGKNFYGLDKDYIMIIARSQRPSTITNGFYEANLPIFSAIMSSAASLITALKSFL